MKIDIDKDETKFVLSGDIEALFKDKRIYLSFARLGIERATSTALVPFRLDTELATLQTIQGLLAKYGFECGISPTVRSDTESYHRELETFVQFSMKAKDIRNNKFASSEELVRAFDQFRRVVQSHLVRTLYPRQLLSAFHMAFAQNACNFAVPGAGKTTIVYAAYAYLKSLPENDPKRIDKLLVVGPLSAFRPWELEYHECFGKSPDVQRLSGDNSIQLNSKKEHLYSGRPAEISLIYHGGVQPLLQEIISFLKRNKTMVVIDEAHRIKNPDGVWGQSAVEIGREAKSRIVLTGTPVPNGYEDLFNLYQFIYPFKYKDILKFHYGNLIEMSKAGEIESDRVDQLVENISPYFIRIKKSDLKLPPVEENVMKVEMGKLQREIYDFVEAKYVQAFRRNRTASVKDILNRAKLIRLRQAATDPSLLKRPIQKTLDQDDIELSLLGSSSIPLEFQDDSEIIAKINKYSEHEIPSKFIATKNVIATKLAEGEKIIVWTIFVQNAKSLQLFLLTNGIESNLLIGEVEQQDREALIKRFNDPGDTSLSVVIANPFSVAESISLHKGCHTAIYMERDYNCSNFIQSKDRIHRVGLQENQLTRYYYVVSAGSIDEVIHDRLEMKARRMEKIIDDEIPLFSRIDDADESDLVSVLMEQYARKTESI